MTGYGDAKHENKHPMGTRLDYTQCAHILPFSLGEFDSKSPLDVNNTAII